MPTKTSFIKVKDITSGVDRIFITALYDTISDTSGDSFQYGSAGGIIAAYPSFANEVTFFGNYGLNSAQWGQTIKDAFDSMGFPNITDLSEWREWNNHVWEFSDGEQYRIIVTSSGNEVGLGVDVNGTRIMLIEQYNQNVRPMMSMNCFNPADNTIQYTRLFYNSTLPPNLLYFRYSTIYSANSLPMVRAATTAEIQFWEGKIIEPSTDPFNPGGESGTGGGTGNFDGTSVDVDFASLPTLSATDTGFITLYNPTLTQLQALASYMWSGAFDLDTFKKLFADPMQAILGLSIVPGPVPAGATQDVKVGNISTGVSMTKAASQYIDIDCGTLNVEEFWGAYLDYEPYTKAEIYLPYIGTHQIAVDDIMGKAVHIVYHIDILSGACAAEIKCGGSVLYTFIGSVAVSIPVTGNDWTNVINGVLSIAGAVGSLVATGGAAAPAAAGEIASAAVNSLKPNIEKSGAVSGGGGLMAGKVPVLILTRPRQALPTSQNTFTGYPAFITRSLGEVSGYTEVHKIRLGGISATDAELDEIENLLKGGVIL